MMRIFSATILMLLAAGCVSGRAASPEALCDGTRAARADHAVALAGTADDRAAVTGARLIALIDAGC